MLAGAVALTVVAVGRPSAASHYFLADVDFLSPVASEAFERFGYQDTEVLLRNLLTPTARRAVADATGLTEAELVSLAQMCEMLQVRGVGPKAARLLLSSGVQGPVDLATRRADELLAVVQSENAIGRWTQVDPHIEIVEQWIRDAAAAQYIVEY
jgi:predicted flap endonuclease-1-like 5' DNA nuclease